MLSENFDSPAKQEGSEAHSIGVPLEHNPYESNTNEYEEWEEGWKFNSKK